MSRTLNWLSCTLVVLIAFGGMSRIARAVDLRASAGDREVIRTVSYSEPATDSIVTQRNVPSTSNSEAPPMAFEFAPPMAHDGCGCATCATPTACGSCLPFPACYSGRYWFNAEFLLWWRNGRNLPPLVTAGGAGALPGSTVLFGNGEYNETPTAGLRIDFGFWLDPCERWGVGGRLFGVSDGQISFAADSNQFPLLARPFFDAADGNTPTAQIIASPTAGTTGSVLIDGNSEIGGGDVYFQRALWRAPCTNLDLLVGYQSAYIDESLSIASQTFGSNGNIFVEDHFATENKYNAAYFGLAGEFRRGCWSLEMALRFGFGNMNQNAIISGSTTTQSGVPPITNSTNSGLLAQSATNGGTHTRDEFAFAEDISFKLAYRPIERLKLTLGYSLMYWSDVLRPGDQINLQVDSRLFPDPTFPATQPAFDFNSTHLIVHGLTFGGELKF